jgi:hypothetical protein
MEENAVNGDIRIEGDKNNESAGFDLSSRRTRKQTVILKEDGGEEKILVVKAIFAH